MIADERSRRHADTVILRSLRTCDEMQKPPRPSKSARRLLAAVLGVSLLLSSASIAGAETPDELREQRKQAQADEAVAAADVDIAVSDAEEVQQALDAIDQDVDAQAAAVEAARRGVAQAHADTATARDRIAELKIRQQEATKSMQAQAVEAFVSFQGPGSGLSFLDSDPWQQARAASMVEFATGSSLDSLDELRVIGANLEAQNRKADEAEAEAAKKAGELEMRLVELGDARDRQNEILDQANERLDNTLAELASLQAIDAQLATEIRNEEQKIADAIAARGRAYSGPFEIPDNLEVNLTRVRGIRVNVVIADQLEGLLAAMSAKGFQLGGGGFRSPSSQIDLRRKNCGSSDYSIWRKPASKCRPPTAPPGRSAHERGLAVDFTYGGRALRSRRSAVYKAMKEVAPKFGFKNLPSEPWHWSVTGT